jgi:hypothetical protein
MTGGANPMLKIYQRGAIWYVRGTCHERSVHVTTKETDEARARNYMRAIEKAFGGKQDQSVYVIRSHTGSIKVGVSTDPEARLSHMRVGSPTALALDYAAVVLSAKDTDADDAAYTLESYAHALMKDKRLHGEWFDTTSNHAIAVLQNASCSLGYELRRWL